MVFLGRGSAIGGLVDYQVQLLGMEYVLQTKLLPFLLISVLRDMYATVMRSMYRHAFDHLLKYTMMAARMPSRVCYRLGCRFTLRPVYLPGIPCLLKARVQCRRHSTLGPPSRTALVMNRYLYK